jgi:cytochrome c-type biogenesis protein CcmH/NrfG
MASGNDDDQKGEVNSSMGNIMMIAGWIVVLLVIVCGVLYIFYRLYGLAKKRYEAFNDKIERIHHHLLLEHLADLASRAKEKNLISPEGYEQTYRVIHEMQMDNLQGKK